MSHRRAFDFVIGARPAEHARTKQKEKMRRPLLASLAAALTTGACASAPTASFTGEPEAGSPDATSPAPPPTRV